jgi:hypothetical protein
MVFEKPEKLFPRGKTFEKGSLTRRRNGATFKTGKRK